MPLLPGYLSFISGVSVSDLQQKDGAPQAGQTKRMLFTTILFVIGFTIVFSLLGSAFGAVGGFLSAYQDVMEKIAGGVIIALGIFLTGLIKIPALYKEVRFLPTERRFGNFSALPLGMAFAIGWTPCVGPILGIILGLAATAPEKSLTLLIIYSLGLGIPFILSGILFARLTRALNWFKKHSGTIHAVSGGILVLIGVLLVTGKWTQFVAPIQGLIQLPI